MTENLQEPKVSLFVHRYLAQRPSVAGYQSWSGEMPETHRPLDFGRKVMFSIPKRGDLIPTDEEMQKLLPRSVVNNGAEACWICHQATTRLIFRASPASHLCPDCDDETYQTRYLRRDLLVSMQNTDARLLRPIRPVVK